MFGFNPLILITEGMIKIQLIIRTVIQSDAP